MAHSNWTMVYTIMVHKYYPYFIYVCSSLFQLSCHECILVFLPTIALIILVPRYYRGKPIWMMNPTTSLFRKLRMTGMM